MKQKHETFVPNCTQKNVSKNGEKTFCVLRKELSKRFQIGWGGAGRRLTQRYKNRGEY